LRACQRFGPPANLAAAMHQPPFQRQPVRPAITASATPVLLAPSMMCADPCHLERELRRLEHLKVDWLHFDLMDAHFVPNMPLGLEVLRALRPKTALPFDVHLMVENSDFFVRELAEIKVQAITVHAEACPRLEQTLRRIRRHVIQAGVALKPATRLTALEGMLGLLDYILLMTVNPGFAGQALLPGALRKIAHCRAWLDRSGSRIRIEVDGNVSFRNVPRMVAAGADILVLGSSSLFHKAGSLRENMAGVRKGIAAGLRQRLVIKGRA